MRKIISFMHVSLDGFVAGPNGEMDWIKVDDELFDFGAERITQTDTALYGRITYQLMESYWPTAADQPDASKHDVEHAAWYKEVHKLVLSTTLQESDWANTEVLNANGKERLQQLRQEEGTEILLFGSPSATHALLQENMIDGFWLFVNPVLLGEGIPLFKNIRDSLKLKLVSTHTFSIGVTELNYEVIREANLTQQK